MHEICAGVVLQKLSFSVMDCGPKIGPSVFGIGDKFQRKQELNLRIRRGYVPGVSGRTRRPWQ